MEQTKWRFATPKVAGVTSVCRRNFEATKRYPHIDGMEFQGWIGCSWANGDRAGHMK